MDTTNAPLLALLLICKQYTHIKTTQPTTLQAFNEMFYCYHKSFTMNEKMVKIV